ncbi:BTAD domain-containing putative transcriptional regulator [Parafrankia sp. BMG5.11]|uniref:nSTAND1 domain-containing NTPase n=1 Tax=Parafrankia sp. BMG5.11 TaxID=222540 RepID=UPI00103F5390|nr:BTAD domain-containing putative transcriptional regulator [Parafrankia sp. BMG5.11]TCJ30281.1 hypothetical protein E0504_49995 [Parafrankia sp. BMG5.11]
MSTAASGLWFGALGPLEVRLDGVPLRLHGPRERTLLGLLLSRHNRVVSVPGLIDGLWGATPPPTAEKTLQGNISRLRRVLEPGRSSAEWQVLVTTAAGYSLRAGPTAVDVGQFEWLVDGARRARDGGSAELAAARLRRALRLWRGDAYEDLGEAAFAVAERRRLDEQRLAAIADRIDLDLALGEAAALVGELRRLVTSHPLRERFWGQLMVAQYESAGQAEALAAYHSARRHLTDELGVDPGARLQALYAAILAGADCPVPSPVRPRPVPAAIGADRNPLAGREADLRWLERAWDRVLDSDSGDVVIVEGEAGMGVSRLVAEFARRVAARGADVVLGLENLPVTSAEELARSAAECPTLVIVDDPGEHSAGDRDPWDRIAGDVAGLPVLVVVTARPSGRLGAGGAWRALRLGPLAPEQLAEIVASYVHGDELPAALAAVGASSAGVPRRIHADSAAWAAARAAQRVGETAAKVETGRRELDAAERAMIAEILRLRQARMRRAEGEQLEPGASTGGGASGSEAISPGGPDGTGAVDGTGSALVCPYKGLARFDEEDARYFFGRDRVIDQLVTRCAAAALLAVVGPSGSGKSSVVRAGLVPALRAGVLPGSDCWDIRVVRTGAIGVADLAMFDTDRADGPGATDAGVADVTAVGPQAGGVGAGAGPASAVRLLVLDQFEEAFTAWRDGDRELLIDKLVRALRREDGRLRLVLTVRADYYGRFARYPELARLVDNSVLVGPMTPDELRQAVERPARVAGLETEPEFIDTVLADAHHEPGVLPLLSTALLATWERRDGRVLSAAAYRDAGGVAGALTRLADSVYEAFDTDGRAAVRRLFLRLATPGEGGAETRRRVPRAELADIPRMEAVLAQLIERRLVVAADGTVEVAHEALLREWPRVRDWLDADRDGRRVHRHLTEAATAWDTAGRSTADLYRGARLQTARDWAAANPGDTNPLEQAFLEASIADEERVADRDRRSARRLRTLVSVLATLLVVALTSTALAVVQRGTANRQAALAQAATRTAQAGRLATLAANLGTDQVDRALLLGVAGYRLEPSRETEAGLQNVLARTPARLDRIIRFDGQGLLPAALPPSVSRDGRLLAEPRRDGTVRIWDLHTSRVLRTLRWPSGRQLAIFNGDATLLSAGGNDGTVVVWNVADGRIVGAPIRAGNALAYGQFDPRDPTRMFVVGGSGEITLWDRSRPDAPRQVGAPLRFPASPGAIPIVPINADGTRLAAGTFGGSTTRIWDARTGQVLRDLDGAPGFFGPDGATLPTTLGDRVTVWDVNTGQPRFPPLTGFTNATPGIVISGDGRRIAANDGATFIRVLDLQSGREVAELPLHEHAVVPSAFLPDGRLMTSGVAEAAIWRLDDDSSQLGRTIGGHDGRATGLIIADDDEIITLGVDDRRVLVWDVATGAAKGPLLGGAVAAPATISPDGSTIAGVGRDGRFRLWNRSSGAEIAVLGPPSPSTLAKPATAWSPANGRLVTAIGGVVQLWDVSDPRHPHQVGRLGRADQAPGTGQPPENPPDELRPSFSHDGRWLAVEDTARRTVTVYDTATSAAVWTRQLDAVGPPALAFSPDDSTLAVGYGTVAAGVVDFRDVRTGDLRRTLRTGFSNGGVEYLRDGSVVMTTSDVGDHSVAQLWDSTSLEPIGEPLPQQGGAYSITRARGGTLAITGTTTGFIQIWDVGIDHWIATACSIAGRNLTPAEWNRYLPGEPYRRTCPQWSDGA